MSDMQHQPGGRTLNDESVAELVKRAASQTAELVRKEIQLGQVELKDKGRRAGKGVGLLGAAGLIGFYGGGGRVAAAAPRPAAGGGARASARVSLPLPARRRPRRRPRRRTPGQTTRRCCARRSRKRARSSATPWPRCPRSRT